MCGIAGEILLEPAAGSNGDRRSVVQRMLQAMASRGPDETCVVAGQRATLGCCRLAIIDVANGRQPMCTPDGRYTLVYNGECYALTELREELSAQGR